MATDSKSRRSSGRPGARGLNGVATAGSQPSFSTSVLTPTRFLERAERIFAGRLALIDGERRFTYRELGERCARLAGALVEAGVEAGARVSVLAPNGALALESHFGVPWAGAVLKALNIRLAPQEL